MELTTHHSLLSWLRICGHILPFSHMPSWHVQGEFYLHISAAFRGCALQCLSNSLWFPEFATIRNRPISQEESLVVSVIATQHKAVITRWSMRIWEQFCMHAGWWRLYYICIKYAGERTASKGPEMHTVGSSFWVMAVIVCLRK